MARLVWILVMLATTAVAEPRAPIVQSLELVVPQPPVIVTVGGARQLVYELHVTNLGADPVTLTRIAIRDADHPERVLGELRDAALDASLARPGLGRQPRDPRAIAAGLRAVVYLWLPLADGATPARLSHRVEADRGVVDGGDTHVSRAPISVLGPPVSGGRWVAIYDPAVDRGHRRYFYTVDGRTRIPARFATDWMKLGDDDRVAPRGAAQLRQWYGYGADVLAVADARVVEARDDVADDTPIGDRAPLPLERASGNYVVLDLGGRYAFYEHLKPHSLRVRPGARVRRGDVLAQLGNTGSSSAGPHLHFHVADVPASLAAEGLPYVLDRFELLGTFQFPDDAATTPPIAPRPASLPAARRRELPPPNAVVRW